jgi:hypothetical protein
MSIPGFTAEFALGVTKHPYRTQDKGRGVASGLPVVAAQGVSGAYMWTWCREHVLTEFYVDIHPDGTMTGHHVPVGSC